MNFVRNQGTRRTNRYTSARKPTKFVNPQNFICTPDAAIVRTIAANTRIASAIPSSGVMCRSDANDRRGEN